MNKAKKVFASMLFAMLYLVVGSYAYAVTDIMQKPTDWKYTDEVYRNEEGYKPLCGAACKGDVAIGKTKKCRFGDYCDGWDAQPYHTGLDYQSQNGSDEVRAVAVGKVVRIIHSSAESHGFGNLVILKHYCVNKSECSAGGTVYSFYAHMKSIDTGLSIGMWVYQGQKLGVIGGTSGVIDSNTGKEKLWPEHLHLELKQAPVLYEAAAKDECMNTRKIWHLFSYREVSYGYSPQKDPKECGYFNPDDFIGKVAVKDLSVDASLPIDHADGVSGEYGIKGFGYAYIDDAEIPIPETLPDFITVKTWLKTPWGVETYKYGLNESIDTSAQAKNIGEGMCNGDITGHFYLSKGYKEDSHSGNGAWRRLDSTNTHCSNLDPGATHTETKNTNLWEWITEPGIYNIVYCMDHPQDDHNNGGDYAEEHESNNCSTEAVFEVVEGVVNMPDTDLVVSSIGIKSKSFLYTNEMYGAFMTIRNTGAVLPATTIRSQYAIKGPGTNDQWTQIADDGSEASNFSHNRDQYEEMISLIQAPSVPGWYTLRGCADYLNLANETNETNNCTEIPFEVIQAYPDFIVSALSLREGTSIKKNTRVHPYCTVQNIGNGAPPRSILIAYYINSGVFRDNDTVEASEIGPGQSKTENVQNDNIKLGDKGNRTYTCCVDYQGQVAESNEGNNCATISFKVK